MRRLWSLPAELLCCVAKKHYRLGSCSAVTYLSGLAPKSIGLVRLLSRTEAEVASDLEIRVLAYMEDGLWCALALEMNLRGHGKSPDEAMLDLEHAIEAQVSFAIQHQSLQSIFTLAEDRYLDLYESAGKEALRSKMTYSIAHSQEENWISEIEREYDR